MDFMTLHNCEINWKNSKELTLVQIDRGNVANNYFQASRFGVPNVTYR